MKKIFYLGSIILVLLMLSLNQWSFSQETDIKPAKMNKQVAEIFSRRCTSCHGGNKPALGMNLEKSNFILQTLGVKSKQKKEQVLVQAGKPEASYLVNKVRGSHGIQGERMPLRATPLQPQEIKLIEKWIRDYMAEFKIDPATRKAVSHITAERLPGTQLINLPTPTLVPSGHLLFKISHRFYPTVESGYDSFYGFDGPANIQFAFGYGIFKNIQLAVSRTNQYQEWQVQLKWLALRGEKVFPFSLALGVGGSWASQDLPETIDFEPDKVKFSSQVILAIRVISPVTILLVPSYATNVNHLDPDADNIFVFATGMHIKIFRQLSLMAEWLPRLAGYNGGSSGWGFGLEYVIGKHIFHMFVTNSTGLTTNQYLMGGTPFGEKGEIRIGFNIFREF